MISRAHALTPRHRLFMRLLGSALLALGLLTSGAAIAPVPNPTKRRFAAES